MKARRRMETFRFIMAMRKLISYARGRRIYCNGNLVDGYNVIRWCNGKQWTVAEAEQIIQKLLRAIRNEH